MEAFGKYSQELEEIQRNYEQNKVCKEPLITSCSQ